jgi:nickel-dependent lactate racemase
VKPQATFAKLVSVAQKLYTVPVPHQYDVVVAEVGFPKDSNLYQASRAPSYIFFVPTPVIKKGGVVITPAKCDEGAGKGIGEQRFYKEMHSAPTMSVLWDTMRKKATSPVHKGPFSWQRLWKLTLL